MTDNEESTKDNVFVEVWYHGGFYESFVAKRVVVRPEMLALQLASPPGVCRIRYIPVQGVRSYALDPPLEDTWPS